MKGKKQRKNIITSSPLSKLTKIQVPSSTKIKFNLSMDNLSCFIGQKKIIKKCLRKTSQSIKKNKKSQQKYQKETNKIDIKNKQSANKRKLQASPDISIQLSNKIISNIEKRGIHCPWNQSQQNITSKQQQYQLSNQEIWTVFSNQFNKSYASTNDFHHYQNYTYSNYQINRTRSDSLTFTIQIQNIGNDLRTTVMIRNIPNKYTISQLASQIDEDHANYYDFLYLPCDFNNLCNVGYGFINFISTEYLKSFYCKFQHYVWRKYKSEKICALTYARLQGLNQLIQHFQNSKVLNQKQKKYRPIIKYDKIHQMVLSQQKR